MRVSVSAEFLKVNEAGVYPLSVQPPINEFLFIKQNTVYHKVRIDDITHLESDNVYINVNTPDNKFLVRNTIDQYLEILNSKQFIRVHRSYAININHIQLINGNHAVINNNTIPIGKAYKNELLNRLRLG